MLARGVSGGAASPRALIGGDLLAFLYQGCQVVRLIYHAHHLAEEKVYE